MRVITLSEELRTWALGARDWDIQSEPVKEISVRWELDEPTAKEPAREGQTIRNMKTIIDNNNTKI